MSITQTVEVPASHRLTIDVPLEIPTGRTVLTFTPAAEKAANTNSKPISRYFGILSPGIYGDDKLPGGNYNTVEEALQAAAEKAADPNRKPISRLFGKHKGIFGGDGVAYQRAIRDEWD